jgi:hypothetical protein
MMGAQHAGRPRLRPQPARRRVRRVRTVPSPLRQPDSALGQVEDADAGGVSSAMRPPTAPVRLSTSVSVRRRLRWAAFRNRARAWQPLSAEPVATVPSPSASTWIGVTATWSMTWSAGSGGRVGACRMVAGQRVAPGWWPASGNAGMVVGRRAAQDSGRLVEGSKAGTPCRWSRS